MALWKRKTDPADFAVTIAILCDSRSGEITEKAIKFAVLENPKVNILQVEINIVTTFYAISVMGAYREFGPGAKLTRFVEALQIHLRNRLALIKGVINPDNKAALAIDVQAKLFFENSERASNPLFAIAKTFLGMLTGEDPQGSASVFRALEILTPFLGDVAKEIQNARW